MAGIAGISAPGRQATVEEMLEKMSHRGGWGREVAEVAGTTLGVVWPRGVYVAECAGSGVVRDTTGQGHRAEARAVNKGFVLTRNPIGVAPLYYGRTGEGLLCFASEVKALLGLTEGVEELPPGSSFDGTRLEAFFTLGVREASCASPEQQAAHLRRCLEEAVKRCIHREEMGSWLSGGLDSSAIASLARPQVRRLHTVVAGLGGAPDLGYARQVADFIQSEHHEVVVSLERMLGVLPKVIWHLESFDALLVRSSIMNYLAAECISQYVPETFSGEGGDELLAGYEYLKALDSSKLAEELIDITGRLHNTALQRVDRCAGAHGLVVHVPFAAPEVFELAARIPVEMKLRGGVEKWILRRALDGSLPPAVLNRPKAKFWEGAGVGDLLARHADGRISDGDYSRERALPNRWVLHSKEELMYYRIFREHFGDMKDLSWMGRTKGAPPRRAEARGGSREDGEF